MGVPGTGTSVTLPSEVGHTVAPVPSIVPFVSTLNGLQGNVILATLGIGLSIAGKTITLSVGSGTFDSTFNYLLTGTWTFSNTVTANGSLAANGQAVFNGTPALWVHSDKDYTAQDFTVIKIANGGTNLFLNWDSTSQTLQFVDNTTARQTINSNLLAELIRVNNTGFRIWDTDASHTLAITPGSNLTQNRTLTITTGDSSRNLTLSGDVALNQNLLTTSSPSFTAIGGTTAWNGATVGYAFGGTNATSQSGARINLGGGKSFADGAALLAGTADYAGQFCYTADGISFSIARSTLAAGTHDAAVCLNDLVFFTAITCAGLYTGGTIRATSTSGVHHFETSSGAATDNVLEIQNSNTTKHSVIAFYHSTDHSPGTAAIGIGNAGASSEYANRYFITTNPDQGIGNPRDITIGQEGNFSSGGYLNHRMLFFDGTNHTVTCYGVSTSAVVGNTGWHVAMDGRMGVGTTSLVSGAQITVNGTASAKSARLNGTLYRTSTVVGNVGGGTDTLGTYSVPASQQSVNEDTVHVVIRGHVNDADLVGSDSNLQVKYGATTVTTVPFDTVDADVTICFDITRTGATGQTFSGQILKTGPGNQPVETIRGTAAETMSGAVAITITGTGDSLSPQNNDALIEFFEVSFHPAP